MKYILDTNLVVHLARKSKTWVYVNMTFEPMNYPENEVYISFATVAEILSIAAQLSWGKDKMMRLEDILADIPMVAVSNDTEDQLIKGYVDIDTYSQGKHAKIPLPKGTSSRNMGKNDIWIASTAYALHATLLTTDKDFEHLDGIFCKVQIIEIQP